MAGTEQVRRAAEHFVTRIKPTGPSWPGVP